MKSAIPAVASAAGTLLCTPAKRIWLAMETSLNAAPAATRSAIDPIASQKAMSTKMTATMSDMTRPSTPTVTSGTFATVLFTIEPLDSLSIFFTVDGWSFKRSASIKYAKIPVP